MHNILSRSIFRSTQPLSQSVRRYASGPSTGGSNAAAYAVGAVALGGAGYYYYSKQGLSTSAFAKDATSSVKSAIAGNKTFTGGEQGFVSLKLESVDVINHNTKRFRFALPSPSDVSGLQIASALLTKYQGPEMQKAVLRPYTPISDEDASGFVDFLVKKYDGGPMSTHMHDMKPGQRLDFKGPLPKYPLGENQHKHIALIAGGTGITPMYQLVRAIFNNPSDKTKVTLVFGNMTEEDILLKSELADLENTYPNRFRAFYVLSDPPSGWSQGSGHISKDLLKTVLPEPKEDNIKLFVCGPPPMYKAISGMKKSPKDQGELDGALKELGYAQDQVYKF